MEKTELNRRSPLRALEQSLAGGLGSGNIGVVVARTGIGKTAFLVGIALDQLLRGHRVLHLSLGHSVEKVCAYYDEIFADMAHDYELADVWQVRLEMERKRHIHVYSDGAMSTKRLTQALDFMRQHADFAPATIVIDDCDFAKLSQADMQGLRALAAKENCEVWMSAITTRGANVTEDGIPEPVAHLRHEVAVILRMAHDGNGVHITPLKVQAEATPASLKLALDPKTLLLVRE
jgi:KaiC/GvpD/RAD55 family RecA-like ATPase